MWKLLSRAVREVWTVLRFIAFLADGLFLLLRLAWRALRQPFHTLGLVFLGYALIMALLGTLH